MQTIVLDTNILISAIVFGGKPRIILEHIIEGRVRLALSEDIVEELRGVLGGKRFRYPAHVLGGTISEIEAMAMMVIPSKKINKIRKDPDDNRILECALSSKADYVISGDRHLLELGKYQDIRIIKPADFLKEFI